MPLSHDPGRPTTSAPSVRMTCSAAKLLERLLRSCTTTPSGGDSWVDSTRTPCAGVAPTSTRVRPLSATVSTVGAAGPSLAVTTWPLSAKYGDAGSITTRAAPPEPLAGTIVTDTTLPFSDV